MGLMNRTVDQIDLAELEHNENANPIVFSRFNVPKFVLCTYKQFSGRAIGGVQSSTPTRDMLERLIEITLARASKEAVTQARKKSTAWDWQTVRREALEAAIKEFGATS